MKINCGTDIIEIDRIKNAIENLGEKFLQTVFTEEEIKYCEARRVQKYQHYAARFAAKEAAFKALGNDMHNQVIDWKTFEVIKDENGKPELIVNGKVQNLESIDVSISHCKEYANANVVAIFND